MQSAAFYLHFENFVSQAASLSQPGLPQGWTSCKPNSVSRSVYDHMFPGAMETVNLALIADYVLLVSKNDIQIICQAGKLPIVSLFTGLAGFELGLSSLGGQASST